MRNDKNKYSGRRRDIIHKLMYSTKCSVVVAMEITILCVSDAMCSYVVYFKYVNGVPII